jgi:tyrosyl-tRNA synthetase
MVQEGLADSKADAKRKIQQGGVSLDGEKITDAGIEIAETDNGKTLKVGKTGFRKLVIK